LEMIGEFDEFIDAEAIEDPADVAALCAGIGSAGGLLVCNRCDDPEEPIAGILLIASIEQAWVLCASCWRELPWEGLIV
jgi:hypothetical protein